MLSGRGGLDVLVLNVGSGRSVPGLEATEAEWNRVLTLNLTSGMEMLRRATPLLCHAEHPSVVVIGSIFPRGSATKESMTTIPG